MSVIFKQECYHSPGFLLEHLVGIDCMSLDIRVEVLIADINLGSLVYNGLGLISREDNILAQLFPLPSLLS